jgi:hypothetical protein
MRQVGGIVGKERTAPGAVRRIGVAGVALLAALAAVPRPASATSQVPFSATIAEQVTGAAFCPPTQTRYLCVDGTGSGQATHLGAMSESYVVRVDTSGGFPPVSGSACGTEVRTSTLTAANGDQITLAGPGQACGSTVTGQGTAHDAWVVSGGTGRFAGATGSGTDLASINALTNPTTSVTIFTGTISSPGSLP